MLTIEHDFAATVVTLIDEGAAPLCEDVTIRSHDAGVTIEQYDPDRDEVVRITLSPRQIEELQRALSLPEGVYRFVGARAQGDSGPEGQGKGGPVSGGRGPGGKASGGQGSGSRGTGGQGSGGQGSGGQGSS